MLPEFRIEAAYSFVFDIFLWGFDLKTKLMSFTDCKGKLNFTITVSISLHCFESIFIDKTFHRLELRLE